MDANQSPPKTASPFLTKLDSLGLLGFSLYALLTLIPDSSSLVASWPWVFVWQVALMVPWLWLIRYWWTYQRFIRLGFGLDYGLGLVVLGLLGSTLAAPFPQQAIWYGWASVSALAALFALNTGCIDLRVRLKFLMVQGGLSLIFIIVSLGLWISQTLMPELIRLQDLRAAGLDLAFDFSVLELRNWAPIGHQNYVAGYVVLSLPLLIGLSIVAKSRIESFLWGLGVGLGLVALYTTSSRGGLLGLAIIGFLGIISLLGARRVSVMFRWFVGIGALGCLVIALISNNRLRSLLSSSPFDSSSGETAFRLITNATGWSIGRDYPLFGAGPGSVPLLYQKYRPAWAGQEAEWVYQLHSTPAQIWAEFGAWGIALCFVLVCWIVYWGLRLWRSPSLNFFDRVLTWSLLSGLAGYGVVALTDYQLDIVAIIGTLLVYSVCLLSLLREVFPKTTFKSKETPTVRVLAWGVIGLLVAITIWLTPVLRAWQLSSVGFMALQTKQTGAFITNLERSHEFAPWEPYYLYQLGWNFGNTGLQIKDIQNSQNAIQRSQEYFEVGIKASPYQEFGYSSLGWLQLLTSQPQSIKSLTTASRLVPGKRMVFHSLGLSLLQQGQNDLAVQAFSLEILRNPLWLTSPVWRSAQLAPLNSSVQKRTEQLYRQLLTNTNRSELEVYLHRCLGGLYWWQGNLAAAEVEWETSGTNLGLELLAIAQNKPLSTQVPILQAWLEKDSRIPWIEKALLIATKAPVQPTQVQAIANGMEQAETLEQWIKQYAPVNEYRRERTGFGVLSRHIDGPPPADFAPVIDNLAMTLFFSDLLPTKQYDASLDQSLQPLRKELWYAVTR